MPDNTLIATALALLVAGLSSQVQAADAAAGQALYATCIACHGADGAGNTALNAPALAGQYSAYLERQLQHFRSGVRGSDAGDTYGMQMRGMASTLSSDTAVADVVAYISTLPPASSPKPGAFDQRNGENQYNAACGACHGPQAQGNPALNSPRLSGLDGPYLRRQYQNFGAGVRGSHPDDRYGQQMKMMATMLRTDKDVDDVIGFILSQ
jgi:cytochrome c553